MRAPIAAVLTLLALAACDAPAPPAPKAAAASRVEAPPVAAARPGTRLPPAAAEYRYVGRWAATEALCADGAWVFQPRRLSTAGEVSCAFEHVTRTPSGYEIAAACQAQAPPEPARLTLTFAESAKAMMVEGGPFQGPVGLIWCGPPRSP